MPAVYTQNLDCGPFIGTEISFLYMKPIKVRGRLWSGNYGSSWIVVYLQAKVNLPVHVTSYLMSEVWVSPRVPGQYGRNPSVRRCREAGWRSYCTEYEWLEHISLRTVQQQRLVGRTQIHCPLPRRRAWTQAHCLLLGQRGEDRKILPPST